MTRSRLLTKLQQRFTITMAPKTKMKGYKRPFIIQMKSSWITNHISIASVASKKYNMWYISFSTKYYLQVSFLSFIEMHIAQKWRMNARKLWPTYMRQRKSATCGILKSRSKLATWKYESIATIWKDFIMESI